jgi:hypothetical protein
MKQLYNLSTNFQHKLLNPKTLQVCITKTKTLANGERKGLHAPRDTPAGIDDRLPGMKGSREDVGGLSRIWLDVEGRCRYSSSSGLFSG